MVARSRVVGGKRDILYDTYHYTNTIDNRGLTDCLIQLMRFGMITGYCRTREKAHVRL